MLSIVMVHRQTHRQLYNHLAMSSFSSSSSQSCISITREPLLLDPLLVVTKQPKNTKLSQLLLLVPFPSPQFVSRCFLVLLALWGCFNISRITSFSPFFPCTSNQEKQAIWRSPGPLRPCLNFSEEYKNSSQEMVKLRRRYMMVVASGGLNQQRNQIVDAVVIARVLGATLVLPVLQVNQVWGDESEFGDIFDERHFKETLRNDVVVVSSLPSTHLMKRRVNAPLMPFNTDEDWLLTNHMPKLTRHKILILRTFDSRLSKNLSTDLQKLRCKVAFEAIKFQPWIEETADTLVRRMSMNGPYMALHLRLEKDVWVRTGCLPGLGEEADNEIENERSSNPNLLTSRSDLSAEDRYLAGLCPLSGLEISMLLNGLGMPKNTRIYLAGGEPFGGDKALKPLKLNFPQLYNKWSLAKSGELDGLKQKPSILAALDYIVCLKSQLFMENHGGNMARALQGHRIYMDYGKHIKPNKRLLVQLFQNKSLEDSEIKKKIKQIQIESPYLDLKAKTDNMDVVAFPNHHCMCNKDLKVLNAKK